MWGLGLHRARSYDTAQTNRVSSWPGKRGARQTRHPLDKDVRVSPEPRMTGGDLGSVGGSAHPCALPLVWGRLHGSLLVCLRKDVVPV